MSKNLITQILGYSGLLPFIAITLAVIAQIDGAFQLFTIYSLSILAFMAGGAWGAIQQQTVDKNAKAQSDGLQVAILAYLIALLGVLLPHTLTLILFVIAFGMVIFLEQKQELFSGYSPSYRKMRRFLTSVVILCHIALLLTV